MKMAIETARNTVIDPAEATAGGGGGGEAVEGASYKYVTYVSSDISLHPLKM